MAESATDILSIEDAKTQLRIGGDSVDALVMAAVTNAVAYVSNRTGIPLVDRDDTVYCPLPASKQSCITIPRVDCKQIRHLHYYEPDQDLNAEPNASLQGWDPTGANYTTFHFGEPGLITTPLYRTGQDWPDFRTGSRIQIVVRRGFTLGADDEGLKAAVILMMRHFYEAPERFESDFAVNALLDSYQRRIFG